MANKVNPLAGKLAPANLLVNIPKLITAYYSLTPDPEIAAERVLFGTSGHRGSSLYKTFNEWHILAITQAICLYRTQKAITGPLFIGFDTHALSAPAFASALEVLTANKVDIMIATDDEFTPTPVISHAILTYNKTHNQNVADGIVITPSHNPPNAGGFKYNPPNGGPADTNITNWIEKKANEFLKNNLRDVKRISFEKALKASSTHRYDFLRHYINDLENVINMNIIRDTHIHLGVDPMGGAGVHYWQPIAERYDLNMTVINEAVDPTFAFMTVDRDGQIRMDPSSPYAMVNLVKQKDKFDVAFACDTDHDRHGIVTKKAGLLAPNHYLATAINYLLQHRPEWNNSKNIGKTVVTTQMLNWITTKLNRQIYEVPVGFKWFVPGLLDNTLCFGGEESAGATFDRLNGTVWTTDKDGIVLALLSAEITAVLGRDLGDIYNELESELGKTFFRLDDAKVTAPQKMLLQHLTPNNINLKKLAGDTIVTILTTAPGNDASIGGIKVISENGWFVIRPSGTEEVYRVYAESFKSDEHLQQILTEAHDLVSTTFNTEIKKPIN